MPGFYLKETRKGSVAAMLRRFARDERGTTAVEYGLIIVCVSLVILGGITSFGNEMQTRFIEIADFLKQTTPP